MAISQWKHERVCAYEPCGVTFIPVRRGQKFHSDDCRRMDWNEHRVSVRADSNTIKRRSLVANEKNMAVRTMRYFRDLPTESRKIVMQWCAEEGKMAKQKARESSRLEKYIEAE